MPDCSGITSRVSQTSNHLKLVFYNQFTVLKCPQQSPDLNPEDQLRDVVKQECFQDLVQSLPRSIKAVLKVKALYIKVD